MRYLSICSGIEAASVAWHPLGWEAVAFAEIDAFPSAVLRHRFPDVRNLGDMTFVADLILSREVEAPDVLVGGTPCQGFSIAGLRKSLSDDRSNLALQFIRIANAIDDIRRSDGREPAYILWENVPGVLSTSDNAFGTFLAGLVGSDTPLVSPNGAGWTDAGVVAGPERCAAWRCLDAQHFGLAQRRKRVFVLARRHPRGWSCADAILPVIESVRWHSPPRREKREGIAPTLAARTRGGGGLGTDFDCDGGLIAFGCNNTSGPIDVATAVNAHGGPSGRMDFESETFVAYRTYGNCGAWETGDKVDALTTGTDPNSHVLAFAENSRAELRLEGGDGSVTGSLKTGGGKPGQSYPVAQVGMQVRRLTPRECERLQGFPDDFTLVPSRGKPAADGPRYRALGNSMAVPVMRWIGERIALVEAEFGKTTMLEAAE